MKRVGLVLMAVLAVACGSDDVKQGTPECADGERWNPILTQCEPVTLPNNANNQNNANNANNENNLNNENNQNNVDIDMGEGRDFGVVDDCANPGMGSLIGKACAPSGEPLAAADVTISGTDCDGNAFTLTTRSGSDGVYSFDDVPVGTHDLTIEIGSFDTTAPVRIVADMQTDLVTGSEKVCLDQNVNIGVMEGSYDHVEGLLATLNLMYTVTGSDTTNPDQGAAFLSDLNAMMAYDIIFLNCGNYFDPLFGFGPYDFQKQQIGTALRQFVESGRSLYVSDWAHPFVELAFPELVTWVGADDNNINDPRQGFAPQTITANVDSMELQAVLGANTAQIEFPQDPANNVFNDHWAVVESVGAGVVSHLTGDAQLCGQGACMNPAGTQNAAPLLVTFKHASGGTVVFTSFHNERQTTLNQDMELILRFLIFQL